MSADRLGEIRGRLAAVPAGAWARQDGIPYVNCGDTGPSFGPITMTTHAEMYACAALIANAPADLAWLIGEVERLRYLRDGADAAYAANATLDSEREANARLSAEVDTLRAALATADAAGFARGVEAGAAEADAYAAVNLQMAGDTILHDPVLSGRDRSERGFERSAEMQVDGTIHSAAYHAATNIAGRIRALVPS